MESQVPYVGVAPADEVTARHRKALPECLALAEHVPHLGMTSRPHDGRLFVEGRKAYAYPLTRLSFQLGELAGIGHEGRRVRRPKGAAIEPIQNLGMLKLASHHRRE